MKLIVIIMIGMLVLSATAQEKPRPRIFVTDSKSWEVSGGFGGSRDGFGGGGSGGARPQTAEIVKTFNERCAGCIVTMNREKADYVIVLDHEGGKGVILKDNKFALFNKDGDAIGSGSTRSLGNAVKAACAAMMKDWSSRSTTSEQKSEDKKN